MNQPGELPPRRHKRHPLPSTLAVVVAEFTHSKGELIIGQLWDISSAGVCLQVLTYAPVEENTIGTLVIRHPFKHDVVTLSAQVCWASPSKRVTFIGMVFAGGLLGPGSFLDDYMKASWVDQMEFYRENDSI